MNVFDIEIRKQQIYEVYVADCKKHKWTPYTYEEWEKKEFSKFHTRSICFNCKHCGKWQYAWVWTTCGLKSTGETCKYFEPVEMELF